jgi:hypothetical protein
MIWYRISLSSLNAIPSSEFILVERCLSESLLDGNENDQQSDILAAYFLFNQALSTTHSFLRTLTAGRHPYAVHLTESGWTDRLVWCLNQLYEERLQFSICCNDAAA